MLFPRPCCCRCLPALGPCEAARGIGQVRSHRRGGRQQGEKQQHPERGLLGACLSYRIFGNTETCKEEHGT